MPECVCVVWCHMNGAMTPMQGRSVGVVQPSGLGVGRAQYTGSILRHTCILTAAHTHTAAALLLAFEVTMHTHTLVTPLHSPKLCLYKCSTPRPHPCAPPPIPHPMPHPPRPTPYAPPPLPTLHCSMSTTVRTTEIRTYRYTTRNDLCCSPW